MEARTILKLKFYNFVAMFYLKLSSYYLTKATLLDKKVDDYVEKQKAILNNIKK